MKNVSVLIIVISILCFNSSCLKKQNLDDDNLGPAFSQKSLENALAEGVGEMYIDDIKKEEATSFVASMSVQEGSSTPYAGQDIAVESIEIDSENYTINFLVNKNNYANGSQVAQGDPKIDQWIIPLTKQNSVDTSAFAKTVEAETKSYSKKATPQNEQQQTYYMFKHLIDIMYYYCEGTETSPRSCHNLIVADGTYRVPLLAYSQHDCQPNQTCSIKVRKIEFDMILNYLTTSNGRPLRKHITLIVSKEVPTLSRLLRYCERELANASPTQSVVVDDCTTVSNYKFGQSQ